MSNTDIQQKIQNMLDEIPEPEHDEHRREYSMSKQSARWMANMMLMINESSGCAVFTKEDVDHVKFMRKWFTRVMAGIGIAVTAAIGILVTGLFNRAFWLKISNFLATK